MPLRILVTGSNGFVGSHLCPALRALTPSVITPSHSTMDICQSESVERFFAESRPHWVVHCAALSSTAFCRQHPDASLAVNVEGAVNVARACRSVGARLIYCSSDQVYALDGNPYGQHKLLMERRIGELLPDAIGLRLTWMYNVPGTGFAAPGEALHGIFSTLCSLSPDRPMKACTREHRSMTNVDDVVRAICAIVSGNIPGGVYDCGAPNSLTTYDTLFPVVERLHADHAPASALIAADASWERNLAIDASALAALGIAFPTTLDSLLRDADRLRQA